MMQELSGDPPPQDSYTGKLGDQLVVLSLSELRIAEYLDSQTTLPTADGQVVGRPGDFVITADHERYPILGSVFYGTYQVVDRVGSYFVGNRLHHVRFAWPALSHVEFNYGPERGKVSGPKDSWIYQSDEADWGLINADAKGRAHVVVGTVKELEHVNWEGRFRQSALAISALPPVLSLVAVFAVSNFVREMGPDWPHYFLAGEAALLVAGVGATWWMRSRRWALKTAVRSGMRIARDFQIAVRLMGHRPSSKFPGMALWRSAQSDEPLPDVISLHDIGLLKAQIYRTYDEVQEEMHRYHITEVAAESLSWIAAAAVLLCIVFSIQAKSEWSELLAIWLPSVVGAVHAYVWRRQFVRRLSAGKQLLTHLGFAKAQILSLISNPKIEGKDSEERGRLLATIRMLCRVTAEHTQWQLRFAIAEDPNLPV
jgi:hypothetical protein